MALTQSSLDAAKAQNSQLDIIWWVGRELGISQDDLDNTAPRDNRFITMDVALGYWQATGLIPRFPFADDPAAVPVVQEPVVEVNGGSVAANGGGVEFVVSEEGVDVRDLTGGGQVYLNGDPVPGAVGVGAVIAVSTLIARFGQIAIIGTVLAYLSRLAVGTRLAWASLPNWVRAALASVGIVAGTEILIDTGLPGPGGIIPLPGGGGPMDQIPLQGAIGCTVVGSWVANGVTFYRLSDGRLAVQNKHGRWKVWRPKKPIVLMPGGAGDLRTLLRADAVLNRQAKKIAAMLNRRARPSRARTPKGDGKTVVVASDGSRITQV